MIASFADPGQRTTPAPFGHALVAAAEQDDRIVGLTADLGKYTDMHIFAKAFPGRYFQMGMAEQLLFGAAAGMAETGLVPFASTYSVFAARRAYDFICLDIAEPGLNVNIVGGLPGLTTGYGPSHQATEDVAIFRGVPGLTIVDPCDSKPYRNWPPTTGRPIYGCYAGRYRPCSTSTTTTSNSARPKCCATVPTWSSFRVG
jgi:transketolase